MNDKQEKKEENIEAGAKTAHVAGKTAAKAVGTYFGGTVGGVVADKAYDKLSNTKLGQGLENKVGSVVGKTPIVGDANKKLNDAGAVDALASVVGSRGNKANGVQKKNNSNGLKPTGNNNLRKNNPKQADNTPQALQNKNHTQRIWNQKNQNNTTMVVEKEKKEETGENSENTENDSYNEETTNSKTNTEGKGRLTLTKVLIPLILIALICIVIVIAVVASVVSPVSSFLSIFSLDSWFKEDKQYVYDTSELQKANEDYNNAIRGSSDGKIKGIVQEYQEKYGVTLDWVMLDTVIQYRYMLSDHEDLYTGDGSEDISDEELEKRLEELDENGGNTSQIESSNSGVDYTAAKKQIKIVAALMIEKVGDSYISDISVGGGFYNRLIDSDFLKSYYKEFLINDEYETRKSLVDEIFEQYQYAKEAITPEGGYGIISDNMQMYLQTCQTPYATTTNDRGKSVFSNTRNINAGTNYPEYFSLSDYLKGAVEGELGRSSLTEENSEGVKAFVIATLSYMLGSFNVDFYPGVQSINFPTGNCRLVSCDVNNGCSYTTNGSTYGTAYSGTNRGGGIHQPWNDTQKSYMDNILSEIMGIVMVRKGVTSETFSSGDDLAGGNYYSDMSHCNGKSNCMGQKEALADSRNGMTYEEILNKYYTNFDLINIREGLYVEDAAYGNASYDGNVIFYDQNDYKQSFCGRNTSIAAAGCGVTSTAIVISTLTGNRQYDPVYFSNMAKSTGDCGEGISGTNTGFFKKAAQKFNFAYEQISKKNASRVIELLKQGNTMVIAHMGSGHFTNGGHYIVLSGVNDKGQVYVHDPNNRNNKAGKGTGNGWYDFNSIIVKESKSGFYAITKR